MNRPMRHTKKKTLRKLLAEKQVFAPCVWDCLSAKCAERAGFQAMLLSSGALANCQYGMPDFKFLTCDDVVTAVKRITDYSPLPLIVDGEDLYSASPVVVYRNVRRLIDAGAMGILVDDAGSLSGWERVMYAREQNKTDSPYLYTNVEHEVISREAFYQKIKAAVAAAEETDCMIIARSEAKLQYGYDEAFARLLRATELGADMTLCIGLDNLEDSKRMAQLLPGWKMYPDVMARNGETDVRLEDIEPLGFNLVTMHYLEKGAIYGMMLFGVNNYRNNNAVYSELFDASEYINETTDTVDYHNWLEMEQTFLKV